MLLKALDLIRTLGWAVIHFIFQLIDSLFDILKGLNSYDIISSVAGDNTFVTFQKGILIIALTLLGLFAITRFAKKIIDPDDGLTTGGIVKEIITCGLLVIMSVFIFVQSSNFAFQLSDYTSNIFSGNNVTLSNEMLTMFIDHTDSYKASDDFANEDISKYIKNDNFNDKKMYNDKFVTDSNWIMPDEKDYKYSINWLLAIIVGGFFLYSLFFCGMMLARRQIEFLFLFVISPIIFATAVGNKERRSAVIQQLVSLMLQGAVIMLIISLTAIVMKQINGTEFFTNDFKDMVIKSIMYIGCGSFLLTGSQVVNRFIGGNVSANSGREQLMAMMGFGQTMGTGLGIGALATAGAGMMGIGAIAKGGSAVGKNGNSAMGKIGKAISAFGSKMSGGNSDVSTGGIGANLKFVGDYLQTSSMAKKGQNIQNGNNDKLSKFGNNMMRAGANSLSSAVDSMIPTRAMYRRRFRDRGE
ncbi:MAG: hypothetical protein IJ399_04025 [Bacilli bacterium]|nr:hypothetical protein [Bacilli bacterium]